jgi:branched-subunit amino acid ABC-type transport system permease component
LVAVARTTRNNQILEGSSQTKTPAAPNGTVDVGIIQVVVNTGVIAGTVSSQTGRAIPGAQVTLTSGADVRTANAEANGSYQINGVAPGPYTIIAVDLTGGLRTRVNGTLPPNQSALVNLTLTPSGTIRGTAFGRNGTTPVSSGINVSLFGPTFLTTTTDNQGQFLFDFVPLGSFTVGAYSYSTYRLVLIVAALVILAGLYLAFNKTRFGILARATIQLPHMAEALGVDTRFIYSMTFALGAALAGLVGGLYAPTMTIVPTLGSTFIMEAFVTVVVGGADIFLGTAPAAAVLGVVKATMTSWQGQLFGQIGLLIAVIIVIRVLPKGISGFILRERS